MAENPRTGRAVSPPSVIRFGPFKLDLRSAELHKNDLRIRLQDQLFQVLCLLLERPGEIVLREEIRQKLWNGNTAVEFDHSINTAVKRLRDTLRDSAEQPRYIETLPKRG
jgi:DNA-binding winged helix-turn-helix (wHTH) protein